MIEMKQVRRSHSIAWRFLALACIAWCAGMMGCATANFRASQLPFEYHAQITSNAQAIDWSRLATSSVSNDYVAAGDLLEVTIGATADRSSWINSAVRVGENGVANIPLVGDVQIGGVDLPMAEQMVRKASIERGFYRSPHVSVVMQQMRMNRVKVVGGVRNPGVYELPRGSSDLIAAIFAAGGLAENAGTRVEVRRTAPLQYPGQPPQQVAGGAAFASHGGRPPVAPVSMIPIDLAAAAQVGQAHEVLDGDVVMVQQIDKEPLRVIGLVNKPGEFSLPSNQDVYLLDALALAGGRSTQIADRVLVIRRVPGQAEPIVISTSVWEAKQGGASNLRIAAGDVVSVEETVFTVALAATQNVIRIGLTGSVPLF